VTTSSPHLVIIGYVWPEPRSSAAGYHMLSFIQWFLAKGWKVTFASPAALSEHRFDLNSIGVSEVPIALNCSSFDEWIKAQNPQAVLFDRFMMEEQFGWRVAKQCPTAIRLLDTEDIHALREARHTLVKAQKGDLDFSPLLNPNTLFTQMSGMDSTQREVAAIYRCDITLMISSFEMSLLMEQFRVPESLLLHCPFFRARITADHSQQSFEERQHFVSIGNFRHAPNWDAVLWLRESLWPSIRKQLPEAELHIYGAYPPPKATALHQPKIGFHVKGWAEDAGVVLSQARVLLAPLRFGAGLKGKLLDAMECGLPSVTTPIGFEGFVDNEASWPGAVADNEETFVQSAIRLYQDQDLWNSAEQQAATLHTQLHNTTALEHFGHRLDTLLSPDGLAAHRLDNFTGQMLMHHQHKSTQYMSQWIEAKNRLTRLSN
jgi:glycosyltransferase involved in cell wall biosynthesis